MTCKITFQCLGTTEDPWAGEALSSALGIEMMAQTGEGGFNTDLKPFLPFWPESRSVGRNYIGSFFFFFLPEIDEKQLSLFLREIAIDRAQSLVKVGSQSRVRSLLQRRNESSNHSESYFINNELSCLRSLSELGFICVNVESNARHHYLLNCG